MRASEKNQLHNVLTFFDLPSPCDDAGAAIEQGEISEELFEPQASFARAPCAVVAEGSRRPRSRGAF